MMHTISNGNMSFTVDEHGAQLMSLKYKAHEYLWQGDPAYWEDRSPLLFPFVGRFTEGKYTVHGRTYTLPIHGFAKDSRFTAVAKGDDHIVLQLTDDTSTLEVYPFRFTLSVRYELQGSTLTVSYEVRNDSDSLMYFGIGGHPGFQVPMEDGLSFEDYQLIFSQSHTPTRIGHTKTCFLSGSDTSFPLEDGNKLQMSHDMFDDDAIVLKNMADTVTLTTPGGKRSVTMHYPDMPYLGIWHAPRTDASYVCIEPWTSLPSRQDIIEEFSCKSDLIRLAPGKTYTCGWDVTLDA